MINAELPMMKLGSSKKEGEYEVNQRSPDSGTAWFIGKWCSRYHLKHQDGHQHELWSAHHSTCSSPSGDNIEKDGGVVNRNCAECSLGNGGGCWIWEKGISLGQTWSFEIGSWILEIVQAKKSISALAMSKSFVVWLTQFPMSISSLQALCENGDQFGAFIQDRGEPWSEFNQFCAFEDPKGNRCFS